MNFEDQWEECKKGVEIGRKADPQIVINYLVAIGDQIVKANKEMKEYIKYLEETD